MISMIAIYTTCYLFYYTNSHLIVSFPIIVTGGYSKWERGEFGP